MTIGNDIKKEATYISGLPESNEITFQNDEFNPEGQEFVFSSKKEALLFLYAHALSIIGTQKFIEANPGILQQLISYIPDYKSAKSLLVGGSAGLLLASYMFFSVRKSIARGFNAFNISSTNGAGIGFWKIRFKPNGDYLDAARFTGDRATSKEATELETRKAIIEQAKDVFKGDEYRMRLLDESLSIAVLDHKMDGVTNPGPYNEGTFWRQLRNIVDGRGILGKAFDVGFKLFYFNSQTTSKLGKFVLIKGTKEKLNQAQQIKKEVIEHFRTSNDFDDVKNYIELSHDIDNASEDAMSRKADEFKTTIERGDVPYIYGLNREQAIKKVRERMVEACGIKRKDFEKIFGETGESAILKQNDVRLTESSLLRIEKYNDIIEARTIQAATYGNVYEGEKIKMELDAFFQSIGNGPGKHNYSYYQASEIISQILSGKTSNQAIRITYDSYKGSTGIENLRKSFSEPTSLLKGFLDEIGTIRKNIVTKIGNTSDVIGLQEIQRRIAPFIYDSHGNIKAGWYEIDIELKKKFGELKISSPGTTSPETTKILSDIEKTQLRAEIHGMIDDMKKLATLNGEDGKYYTSLKRKVTEGINTGKIITIGDILRIEISGKKIPLDGILHDVRFNDFPEIDSLRARAKTDISKISIEELGNIFKHLKIKI